MTNYDSTKQANQNNFPNELQLFYFSNLHQSWRVQSCNSFKAPAQFCHRQKDVATTGQKLLMKTDLESHCNFGTIQQKLFIDYVSWKTGAQHSEFSKNR